MKNLVAVVLLGCGSSLLIAAAAADENNPSVGTSDPVVVGQTFVASSQDPTEGSAGWALTSHGVSENLYTVNAEGEIVPQIADSVPRKITEDGTVWEVRVKPGYQFSNGVAVDAEHVAQALNELNDKNSNAQSSLGNMTVTVVVDEDDENGQTIRIESERPTHVMDAVLAEWVFVIYLQDSDSDDDDGDFIYTGPYMIQDFEADTKIELVPNRYYDDRSFERPTITVQKYATGDELAKGMKNNSIDVGFHLPVDTLAELRDTEGVRIKTFEVGYQYMMFYNMDSLTLKDVRVRKAIDVATDRTELSQALAGGVGTRSLFPDYSPYYSEYESEQPFGDEDAAGELLEEAGWTINPDTGMRENKEGEELTITLVAYPHRPGLGMMQPVIADTLTDLGINVATILTGMEWSETQQILDVRSFDMMMWAQNTLPAGDPLWFMSAFFRSDGGNNHANFSNADVDTALDALSLAEDHPERIEKSAIAHTLILEHVPVSNLVTPLWHVGLSDRMAEYEPYGSDYYVIRADLFTTDATMDTGLTSIEAVAASSSDEKHEPSAEEDGSSSAKNTPPSPAMADDTPDITALESSAEKGGRRSNMMIIVTAGAVVAASIPTLCL